MAYFIRAGNAWKTRETVAIRNLLVVPVHRTFSLICREVRYIRTLLTISFDILREESAAVDRNGGGVPGNRCGFISRRYIRIRTSRNVERMALREYSTLRNLPGTRSHHQRHTDFQFLLFGQNYCWWELPVRHHARR